MIEAGRNGVRLVWPVGIRCGVQLGETSTRKKVTTRAKRTRNSLEKQVRKQQKTAEKQIKTTNKEVSRTIEARVDAVSKQATKVQTDVTKQAEVQGKKAQEFVNKVTEQLTALV